MLKELYSTKTAPKVLIVTPLKTGDKISRETKITIKRNTVPRIWVSYESDNIRPINLRLALEEIIKKYKILIPYFLPIDNNIKISRGFVDVLYHALNKSPSHIGYAYGNLEYTGHINKKFPAVPFNIAALLNQNYISSNSMFKTDYLLEIGFEENLEMHRLLDWALLLRFVRYGYMGIPVKEASHIAYTTDKNISARDEADYARRYAAVQLKIVKPLKHELDMLAKEKMKKDKVDLGNVHFSKEDDGSVDLDLDFME